MLTHLTHVKTMLSGHLWQLSTVRVIFMGFVVEHWTLNCLAVGGNCNSSTLKWSKCTSESATQLAKVLSVMFGDYLPCSLQWPLFGIQLPKCTKACSSSSSCHSGWCSCGIEWHMPLPEWHDSSVDNYGTLFYQLQFLFKIHIPCKCNIWWLRMIRDDITQV